MFELTMINKKYEIFIKMKEDGTIIEENLNDKNLLNLISNFWKKNSKDKKIIIIKEQTRVLGLFYIKNLKENYIEVYGTNIERRGILSEKSGDVISIFDQLFNNLNMGIIVTDSEKNVIGINKYALKNNYSDNKERLLLDGIKDINEYGESDFGKWREKIIKGENNKAKNELYIIGIIKDEYGDIQNYYKIYSDITQIKKEEKKLSYITEHDLLTGLLNRNGFLNEINIKRLLKEEFTLILLDIDGFKRINDSVGNSIGDKVLRDISDRIDRVIDEDITFGRTGGNEFGLLIKSNNEKEVVDFLNTIKNCFEEKFDLLNGAYGKDSEKIFLTISVGVSISKKDNGTSLILLRNAQSALREAKRYGGNKIIFYNKNIKTYTIEKISMETDIKLAIQNDEFILYYQPQIDIKNNKIIGAEALVRWQHPEKGMISPGIFIPLAEELKLIKDIDRIVMRKGLKDLEELNKKGYKNIVISINLSPEYFEEENSIDEIFQEVNSVKVDTSDIKFEITERSAMGKEEETIVKMERIKEMGCKLAIDDFGTGYSSLRYLEQFPLDTLKVDMSFVKNITTKENSKKIVDVIIALGHTLGFNVIAEGAEEKEQVELLKKMGCDEIQGYYFAKPMPKAEFMNFIDNWR
ncbi:putative bifunctional diguanylate cyclase/phosphodiesterase [Haliovirga abyssi]|uniref:EAL domain-containing protein n=1 Tax=Haliovirga abyssi TaxID=2996794 RepID=A0AAU9D9H6_9FUSO|nr:GGDEF domain-containing phosphodiesterase [Haliovirga abyssi]BDU50241.1 hypothetical protein HLVA_08100 [Haliovirga abyssi]